MSWFGDLSTLGECPRWSRAHSVLSWVDIDGGVLHTARPDGAGWTTSSYPVSAPLAGAVAIAGADDGDTGAGPMLCAVGTGLARWDPAAGLRGFVELESPDPQTPMRMNEMVVDPAGRVWVGSMAYDWSPGAGSLYRVDPDGKVARVVTGLTIANGVAWSPDSATMYTTDTGPGEITAWRYDLSTGTPSNPRVIVRASGEGGRPDGLAVDTDGNLWSAFAGGGRVVCFDPTGRQLHAVDVPAPVPTSCCFAGPERDRLIVTTGRKRLDAATLGAAPDSGRTWDAGRVGAVGLEQPPADVALVPERGAGS